MAKIKEDGEVTVTSSLDVVNAGLVTTGKALVGQGTELETAWFNDSALLLISGQISVRGVQLSMDEALADFDEDVTFPSLTKTMVQNFVQAYSLTQKKGWKGLPVEAIRTIQAGKRSESFETSKAFDEFLATTQSAKVIEEKANKPKRPSKGGNGGGSGSGEVTTTLDGEKVQTFSEAIIELKKIALARTSHLITAEAMADARYIMVLLMKQIKAQESKDAEQLQKVA
jgi:hypothetical protein